MMHTNFRVTQRLRPVSSSYRIIWYGIDDRHEGGKLFKRQGIFLWNSERLTKTWFSSIADFYSVEYEEWFTGLGGRSPFVQSSMARFVSKSHLGGNNARG